MINMYDGVGNRGRSHWSVYWTYSRNLVHGPLCRLEFGASSVAIVKRLGLGFKICSNGTACLWACQERGGRDIMSEIEIGIERVFKVQECLNLPKTSSMWSFEVSQDHISFPAWSFIHVPVPTLARGQCRILHCPTPFSEPRRESQNR
jgi:hypothetical protein